MTTTPKKICRQSDLTPEEISLLQAYRKACDTHVVPGPLESQPHSPKIYGYIRCSHKDSKDSGAGEEAQRRISKRLADLIRADHPELPEIAWAEEEDPVSAYKVPLRDRPGGYALDHKLRAGDHVIFAYLDRGFRNVEDCLATIRRWKERGVTVHFANLGIDMSTPIGRVMGELIITVIAACAKMDSALKSERIKEVFAGFVGRGRQRNGHAPLGFKLTGRRGIDRGLIPDHEKRRIMGEIVRVRDKYGWPWPDIANYIEKWLAEKEGRKPMNLLWQRWNRKAWGAEKCSRAYKAEMKIRQREDQKGVYATSGGNGSSNGNGSDS